MTLNRTRTAKPRKPLAPFSAKRRAELAEKGIEHPVSTFTPKLKTETGAKAKRRPYTGPKPSTCLLVDTRSGKQCEFPGCGAPQQDRHHRLNRKAGGRHGEMAERLNQPAWLLGVCRVHHDAVTAPPEGMVATFERMGWILREGQDALHVEVFTRHSVDPVWLDNAGSWHLFDEAAA